jgi:hypothetical protein
MLSAVKRSLLRPTSSPATGCSMPPSDDVVTVPSNVTLATDWKAESFHLHYLESEEGRSTDVREMGVGCCEWGDESPSMKA